MTAKQFLLRESTYCRRRAASCADPFLAEELRRLAWFERTADAAAPEKMPSDNGREQNSH
ncbi:MAG: hypothetical protein WB691_29400 [Pseudolabrys sp.]